ncbi:MAG: sulfite exporter TauE/SafE family protein [Gammaproteobacteria bacterium]|nr:sulfite exporter TauE/SafE family protein [Gammaproteobacteria bacterium]
MINGELTFLAAALAGLAGSGHCVAMCGGMASLLAAKQHHGRPVRQALTYNLGRVTSYAIAGAIVGLLGQLLVLGSGIQAVAGHLRLVTGLLIAIAGLTLVFGNHLFKPFESLGSAFWKRISPLAVKRLSGELDGKGIFALGLLWGWLPCGMTYAMLATAAVTADPLHAAGLMAAFGIGTLPAMVGTGLAGMKLRSLLGNSSVKRVAGVVMVIIGVWTAQPMTLIAEFQDTPPTSEHHHH